MDVKIGGIFGEMDKIVNLAKKTKREWNKQNDDGKGRKGTGK